jgi:peptide/nickel transport system substrate-binding protein
MAAATPTPAAVAAADRAADQTLRLVGWAQPANLMPQKEGGPLRVMTQNTFRPPFYLDKDGKLNPGIATKWEASSDGLKYTLKLDPRAKFSDGSKVTAADLKFSWEYLSWPETKAWSHSYVAGSIVGYKDVVDGKSKTMAGLVAKDDETLEITLERPYTPFVKSLATYIAGVVKKAQVEKDPENWDEKPICCGPYKVESFNKTTGEVTWVPDENWWGEKPTITRVTYRYVKDANTQSIMYDNNEMDILVSASDLLAAQLMKGPHKADMKLIPYGGSYFYYFASDRKPMEDVNVRRALLKATDMGKIVQAVFQGSQSVAYGIISPNLEGHTNPKPYFDPEGAKKALAESSYKTVANLPPITIAVGTNLPEYIRASEAVQQMWKEVLGLNITVKPYDKATDPVRESAQVFRASLGTLVNDTSAAVSAMGLSSANYMNGSVKAKNDKLDEILTKADSLPMDKQQQRIELYQDAERIIMDNAYYIPIIWVQYYHIVKPWVRNFASNTDLGLYSLPQMSLAKR